MKKLISFLLLVILFMILLSGCESKEERNTITIAEQYGLAYAPVQIMKDRKILEENLADFDIKWEKLTNTAAIRESMLTGKVDIGFMAIPPFLIGRDKGMEWKIISGLSASPLGLMTYKDNIHTLTDISKDDRIALPQPGSVQHILLAMAAEKEFGDVDRFDDQLVTMAHPDGMNALLSKREITAHFTSPPYIFKESEEEGIHQILSGKEALGGDFSFIVGVSTEDFYNNQPEIYKVFLKSLDQSIEYINNYPAEAATILSESYNLPEGEIREYISSPGMSYNKKIQGLDEFISFMQEANYIKLPDVKPSDLIWEVDNYEK